MLCARTCVCVCVWGGGLGWVGVGGLLMQTTVGMYSSETVSYSLCFHPNVTIHVIKMPHAVKFTLQNLNYDVNGLFTTLMDLP